MRTIQRIHCPLVMALLWVIWLMAVPCRAQQPVINRGRGKEMLHHVKDALREVYYDPKFHGMNVEARFAEAEKQINEATSTWQINAIIAQVLLELDDSHTRFFPPDLVVGVNFGFRMQMIGDLCYVTRVKAGSDAEKKGLKVGDLIYAIENFEPTRQSLWKLIYSYFVLLPPPSLRVTVQDSNKRLTELSISPAVKANKKLKIKASELDRSEYPPEFVALSNDVIVCKLRAFDLNFEEAVAMMKRIREQATTLILDLRGNGGGTVFLEQLLLGHFFEKDIKIGDLHERSKSTARMAKSQGPKKIFSGKVIVLVDSESASAAEVFARIMQLEKRGFVLGDITRGAVMTSVSAVFTFKRAPWDPPSSFYGANLTIGDLIMSDGKSLEKVGVTPDEIVLPSGDDLAARRDVVLARAAALVGIQLDPAKAGTMFPLKSTGEETDTDADKEQ